MDISDIATEIISNDHLSIHDKVKQLTPILCQFYNQVQSNLDKNHTNCQQIQLKFDAKKIPPHSKCEYDENIFTFYWEEKLICLYDEQNGNFNVYDYRNGSDYIGIFNNFESGVEELVIRTQKS